MNSVTTIRGIILFAFGAFVVLMALRSLRAQRLKEEYALLYLFVGLPFLVLAFWPDAVVVVSDTLDIEKPTLLILAMGTFILLVLFKLTSIISVQDRRINSLTQLLAILTEDRQFQGNGAKGDSIAPITKDEGPDANEQH
jgi:hypothetical protein